MNQNTYREGRKFENTKAKTNQEEGGDTLREEGATLRCNKDPRKEEVRDKDGAGGKGVTRINTQNPTKDVSEKHRALDKGSSRG